MRTIFIIVSLFVYSVSYAQLDVSLVYDKQSKELVKNVLNSKSNAVVSFVYNKQSKELELTIENKDKKDELWIFDIYNGTVYSTTVKTHYSKNGVDFKEEIFGLRERDSIYDKQTKKIIPVIRISPLQTRKFTFPWFSRYKEYGYRYFKINYDIVHCWNKAEDIGKLYSKKGEFEIKEP